MFKKFEPIAWPPLFLVFTALYCVIHSFTPILGNKVAVVFGFTFMAGHMGATINNGFLDVINNVWGKKTARQIVLASTIARVAIWLLVGLVVLLPTRKVTAGFDDVALSSFRLLIASLITHTFTSYVVDIGIFDAIRKRFKAAFWLRYNVSNIVNLTIGNFMFTVLAHAGTDRPILSVMLGNLLLRFAMSFALTPVFSALVKVAEKDKARQEAVAA